MSMPLCIAKKGRNILMEGIFYVTVTAVDIASLSTLRR